MTCIDLRDSSWFTAEHAIAVYILTYWRQSTDPKENAACLIGNCDKRAYAQKCDAENELGANIREKIFSLFLNLSNSRVILIIKLKAQADENSTYA